MRMSGRVEPSHASFKTGATCFLLENGLCAPGQKYIGAMGTELGNVKIPALQKLGPPPRFLQGHSIEEECHFQKASAPTGSLGGKREAEG